MINQELMALQMACNIDKLIDQETGPSKTKKKCLVCQKEHTHNNSFCSAECSKNYTS